MSEHDQLRIAYGDVSLAMVMRSFLLLLSLSVASSGLLEPAAQAGREDFGMGAASVACAMLDSGYSRPQVEQVLSLLERDIMRSGISSREQQQMARGFNNQAQRNNCYLRYRY